MKARYSEQPYKFLMAMTLVMTMSNVGGAQTVGYSSQRVYLKLGDVMQVRFTSPDDKSRMPTHPDGTATDLPGVSKDYGNVIRDFRLPSKKMGGQAVYRQLQIFSGKQFNISVVSNTRRIFPESISVPRRMIYLTDVLYTASQK